ncbi:MAG: MSMEG_0567/Sll0786 family nitrogen starvation N-acetyltransferase [Solirubrobacteraceae bacterium]
MTSSPAPVTSAPRVGSVCRLAAGPAELEAHFAVRRCVFVEVQRLFDVDDRDEHDELDRTLHAVADIGGAIVGAVRLYPLDAAGLWKGDRLAVLPDARVHRVGGLLVDFAVRTAGELGGQRMVAQIQQRNLRFFDHLGWVADGPPAPYHGVIHQPMTIALRPSGR